MSAPPSIEVFAETAEQIIRDHDELDFTGALDRKIPGWRQLDLDEMEDAIRAIQAKLLREADAVLDTYNATRKENR